MPATPDPASTFNNVLPRLQKSSQSTQESIQSSLTPKQEDEPHQAQSSTTGKISTSRLVSRAAEFLRHYPSGRQQSSTLMKTPEPTSRKRVNFAEPVSLMRSAAPTKNQNAARPPSPLSSKNTPGKTVQTERFISQRPFEEPTATFPRISKEQGHKLGREIIRRIEFKEDLGRMWDRAVEADRHGLVNDELYDQLEMFFYGFLPMILYGARK